LGTIRLWSAQGQLAAAHEHDEDIYAMTFAPEGQTVVFGDLHGNIRAWDFVAQKAGRDFDGKASYKLDYIQDIAGLRVLMFLDGGKTLAAAGTSPKNGATIQSVPLMLFFDFASGKPEREFRHGAPKDGFINDMAWHPDGYLLLATSGDPGSGKLQFLRPTESEPFYTNTDMANCHSVALHPDGKRFAVTATNRNSNGNGRPNNKDGRYPGNHSPIHFFELPA
jgi:WD40 repeat protein